MILNVSGRTDICAFYSKWFWNRYQEGYVDVRNPFYPQMVSRISFSNVDLILFCTKNPLPILPYLKKITQPILFQVTLTPYKKEIEPNVPEKKEVIEGIQKIAQIIGKENVYVRYDPIFINEKYTISYHERAFQKLCSLLEGSTNHIIVSFLDDYKNVRKNIATLNPKTLTQGDYQRIGTSFSKIAETHHMSVQTCCEEETLFEYGFIKEDCISKELAKSLTGKTFKKWNARGKKCSCVEMVDIGEYNTCSHFCKYCYANYDEEQVARKRKMHDDSSSLLIGKLAPDDIIKPRKD